VWLEPVDGKSLKMLASTSYMEALLWVQLQERQLALLVISNQTINSIL
jgi:hypothetical protein